MPHCRQRFAGVVDGVADFRVRLDAEDRIDHDADFEFCRWFLGEGRVALGGLGNDERIADLRIGQAVEHGGGVAHGARLHEIGGKSEAAFIDNGADRHAPTRRLQADAAAPTRRNTDGAADIRAVRDGHHT